MSKVFKWLVFLFGGLVLFLVLAIILIPLLIDINHYKPQIEEHIVKATDHPFTLGGDIKLSLFPWVGISLSDMHFGNPKGFSEKDMVTVDEFRVKVKVLPLLSKKVQVKEFLLDGARIILETRKDGKTGWQDLTAGDSTLKQPKPAPKNEKSSKTGQLPISDLQVAEFTITNSSLLWSDHKNNVHKEIRAFELILTDLSLDRPIGLNLSVIVDGYPVDMDGLIGPVGQEIGKGTVPVNLSLAALDQVKISLKGVIKQPAIEPSFDLDMSIKEFSPRKLLKILKQPLPMEPADPKVLTKVGLSLHVKGSPKAISLSKGKLSLDDSSLDFSAAVKEFSKPDVAFDLKLDQIDLDRYLPAPVESESKTEPETTPEAEEESQPKQIDYTPLRKLVLDGKVGITRLKVKNIKTENVTMKVTARDGLLKLDPFSMSLYRGQSKIIAKVNVKEQSPKTNLQLIMNTIQAGPLVKDLMEKDVIEGSLKSNMSLKLVGDTSDQIRKTISGNGSLNFNNGAIKGVDLAAMMHNVATAFNLSKKGTKAPETEFAELAVPFRITKGLFATQKTYLKSPVLHVQANGKANLVTEALDFKVNPKFVNPLKGQKEGIVVPLLVSGTFEKPKFKPDLKAAFKQNLGDVVDKESERLKKDIEKEIQKEINKRLPGKSKKSDQEIEKTKQKLKEDAQKLFKGLPFSK
jgi:AsmA protein